MLSAVPLLKSKNDTDDYRKRDQRIVVPWLALAVRLLALGRALAARSIVTEFAIDRQSSATDETA